MVILSCYGLEPFFVLFQFITLEYTYYANIFGTNHWLFYYNARAIKLEIFSTGYDDDVAILSFFVGNFLDLHIREFSREFVEYLHLQ